MIAFVGGESAGLVLGWRKPDRPEIALGDFKGRRQRCRIAFVGRMDRRYSAGNALIGSKFYYTGITGQAYTSEEVDYNGAGLLTRTAFTGVTGAALTNPLILKDSKTPEFLIPAHDDVANRAGQKRACASRSIGWNWFMVF